MGFRGSRVQIPPSRFCPRECGGQNRSAWPSPTPLASLEEAALPSSYSIDPGRRLVTTRIWGTATDEDVLGHNRRLRADALFDPTYRQLADMSEISEILVNTSTIEEISRGQLFTPGTKRAFVASDDAVFGLLRKYELHADSLGQTVRVFRDRKAAEAWLGL